MRGIEASAGRQRQVLAWLPQQVLPPLWPSINQLSRRTFYVPRHGQKPLPQRAHDSGIRGSWLPFAPLVLARMVWAYGPPFRVYRRSSARFLSMVLLCFRDSTASTPNTAQQGTERRHQNGVESRPNLSSAYDRSGGAPDAGVMPGHSCSQSFKGSMS